jgi:hypothetical protein
MKIHLFNIANFKADGGAMFGVIPRALWSRVYPADERNLVTITLRSMVVETGRHTILIDTGWGDKQDENKECCTLEMTPKGIRVKKSMAFSEI